MRIGHLLFLLCFPLLVWGQTKLAFRSSRAFVYQLRLNDAGDSVHISDNRRLSPWLPQEQFGWQFMDSAEFLTFFRPIHPDIPLPDFQQEVVLALIRYESFIADMQVQHVEFQSDIAQLSIHYRLAALHPSPNGPMLNCLILRIPATRLMQQLGLTNFHFQVKEEFFSARNLPAPSPIHPESQLFPLAFTLEDLYPLLELYQEQP
ncbi:MAG: hypothetical protein AAF399_28020 [Bacteroidota bacterium]